MNITPENITKLAPDEVFVYGANEAARHGLGAAKTALKFGAIHGRLGYVGQTFSIPTKDKNLKVLPLIAIKRYLDICLLFARNNPQLKFYITKIGTGLSGYSYEDICNIFPDLQYISSNVYLPQEFVDILSRRTL